MLVDILLSVAVLCLAITPRPILPQQWIAVALGVIALLAAALRWSP